MAFSSIDVRGKHSFLFISCFDRLVDIDFVVLDVILLHLFLQLVDFLTRWDQPEEEKGEEGADETDSH